MPLTLLVAIHLNWKITVLKTLKYQNMARGTKRSNTSSLILLRTRLLL